MNPKTSSSLFQPHPFCSFTTAILPNMGPNVSILLIKVTASLMLTSVAPEKVKNIDTRRKAVKIPVIFGMKSEKNETSPRFGGLSPEEVKPQWRPSWVAQDFGLFGGPKLGPQIMALLKDVLAGRNVAEDRSDFGPPSWDRVPIG